MDGSTAVIDARRGYHTFVYEDKGCNLSPSCLNCPYEICQFEEGEARKRQEIKLAKARESLKRINEQKAEERRIKYATYLARNLRILELYREGKPMKEIAVMFALTYERIWYIVDNLKKAGR